MNLKRFRDVQVEGTGAQMPFGQETFDRVVGRRVLLGKRARIELDIPEEIVADDAEEIVVEVLRVLRPGGTAELSFGLTELFERRFNLSDRRMLKQLILEFGGTNPRFIRDSRNNTLVLKFQKAR